MPTTVGSANGAFQEGRFGWRGPVFENRRAPVIHGTRFQRWGMGCHGNLGLKPQAVI